MPHFLVSFRIESNSTYQYRYDSLQEQIAAITSGVPWEETSSVYIFRAAGTAESVGHALYYKSKLVAPSDMLVVIDLNNRKHVQYGCEYPNLLLSSLGF